MILGLILIRLFFTIRYMLLLCKKEVITNLLDNTLHKYWFLMKIKKKKSNLFYIRHCNWPKYRFLNLKLFSWNIFPNFDKINIRFSIWISFGEYSTTNEFHETPLRIEFGRLPSFALEHSNCFSTHRYVELCKCVNYETSRKLHNIRIAA